MTNTEILVGTIMNADKILKWRKIPQHRTHTIFLLKHAE